MVIETIRVTDLLPSALIFFDSSWFGLTTIDVESSTPEYAIVNLLFCKINPISPPFTPQ
jgi:hypothetical protein